MRAFLRKEEILIWIAAKPKQLPRVVPQNSFSSNAARNSE